jgi:hypothetical protein
LRTCFKSKNLDLKHVLKVYFKPSRKNPDFGFVKLPFPSRQRLVWLKKPYLRSFNNCFF